MIYYQEDVLNLFATCPLRTESPDPDRHFSVAGQVLHWALLREFYNDRPKLSDVREKYCEVWKSLYYPEYSGTQVPPTHPSYWEGPRTSALVGKRIHDLILRYEVLHPIQPYTLTLGLQSVRGSYALLRRHVGDKTPLVLSPSAHAAPSYKAYPDMRSLARWLNARRNSTDHRIGILFFPPVLQTKTWTVDSVDERLATKWLGSILDAMPHSQYANPGPHCLTCIRKDCSHAYER